MTTLVAGPARATGKTAFRSPLPLIILARALPSAWWWSASPIAACPTRTNTMSVRLGDGLDCARAGQRPRLLLALLSLERAHRDAAAALSGAPLARLPALRHLHAHLGIRHPLHQQPALRPHLHPGLLQRQILPRRARRKNAAWVWAFYPFAIYFSAGRVWEYSLTGLLFTTCFCIAQRIHRTVNPLAWLGWGALYGLTALSNPAVLSTLPFLLCSRSTGAHRSGRRWLAQRRAHPACCSSPSSLHGPCATTAPWASSARFATTSGWKFYATTSATLTLTAARRPARTAGRIPASNPAEMRKYPLSWANRPIWRKSTPWPSTTSRIIRIFDFLALKTLRRVVYYWTGYWSFSAEELQAQPYEPSEIFFT